jgi:hypothetical protein
VYREIHSGQGFAIILGICPNIVLAVIVPFQFWVSFLFLLCMCSTYPAHLNLFGSVAETIEDE